MKNYCVHVVDDDEALCEGLEYLLRSDGLQVKTYKSAQEFLDCYNPDEPGVLVLDVRMHEMDGLQLQEHLVECGYDIPVIMLTGHGDVPIAVKALKAGAVEFLQKPVDEQPLFASIYAAAKLAEENRKRRKRMRNIEEKIATLTKRETEVMNMVVDGMANKQIASTLYISSKTVEVHRKHMMVKMDATSIAELTSMICWLRNQRVEKQNAAGA